MQSARNWTNRKTNQQMSMSSCLGDDLLQPCRHILLIPEQLCRLLEKGAAGQVRLHFNDFLQEIYGHKLHKPMAIPTNQGALPPFHSAMPSVVSQNSTEKIWKVCIHRYQEWGISIMYINSREFPIQFYYFVMLSWQNDPFHDEFQRHNGSLGWGETRWRTLVIT